MKAQRIAEAVAHRKNGQFEAAHAILRELHAAEPDDATVNLQLAWLHDTQGLEKEAVPYYEIAVRGTLTDEELRDALLGLGSTYRCLGRYAESVETLRRGVATFPDARQFPVFLAMALYNTGQHAEAMQLLLHELLETTQNEDILAYQNAIRFYHDKLDETWD